MPSIDNLQPSSLWKNFQLICSIPHPSKKEQKIIDHVRTFGQQLGLETYVDKIGNIIIKKKPSPGMENKKTVILQGHLDMVPQKNNEVSHDFEHDPIEAYIYEEWVRAKGTTLGADNGIGVAAIMAILQATNIEHGPLVALFTISEEIGMIGASEINSTFLSGDILLNLDTEDEGELYIGCAGALNTDISFHYSAEPTSTHTKAFKIIVGGLKGGHSGMDINLGRGNSIKLLNRLLWQVTTTQEARLSSLKGGTPLHNAIPREAHATIIIPKEREKDLLHTVSYYSNLIKEELAPVEPDLKIEITSTKLPDTLIDHNTQIKLIKSLYGCPHGVLRLSDEMPGLVETSTNLGYIKSEHNMIKMFTSQRSAIDSAKDNVATQVRSIFELAHASITQSGRYPGWKPNLQSEILDRAKKAYKELFKKEPKVKATHAGLECSLFAENFPDMDIISFGPTIKHPHSPAEKVHIESVNKFWSFLIEILKQVPNK